MKNTNFVNVHGLDDDSHYSCPYDMAIMARELIKHENILKYTNGTAENFLKPQKHKIFKKMLTNKAFCYKI